MSGDNSRLNQSEKTRAREPGGGVDAATRAVVTGGEAREWAEVFEAISDMGHMVHQAEAAIISRAAAREMVADNARYVLHAVGGVERPKPLHSRPTGEAEAWRDGWRAAMSCAVLVAETARAPAAVDLLQEQLEPPV